MTPGGARGSAAFLSCLPWHADCCTFIQNQPLVLASQELFRGDGAMTRKKPSVPDRSAIKQPEEWVSGDEPMTGAQDSYVHTLARDAGEDVPEQMTKAEASHKIEELQEKTGRGTDAPKGRRHKKSATRKKAK
jgi:hypothetical protein